MQAACMKENSQFLKAKARLRQRLIANNPAVALQQAMKAAVTEQTQKSVRKMKAATRTPANPAMADVQKA